MDNADRSEGRRTGDAQSSDSKSSGASSNPGLVDRLAAYLDALRSGEPVDRAAILAEFPEVAEQLAAYLDALEFISKALSSGSALLPAGPRPDCLHSGTEAADTLGDYTILREVGRGGMGVVYEAQQRSLQRRVALKVLLGAAAMNPRQLQRFKHEALAAASLDHPHIVRIYTVGCDRGVHYYAMQLIQGMSLSRIIRQRKRVDVEGEDGFLDTTRLLDPELEDPGFAELASRDRVAPSTDQANSSTAGTDQLQDPDASRHETLAAPLPVKRDRAFFDAAARLGIQAASALEHAHRMGIVHRDIKPSNLLLDARGHLWIADFGLAMTRASSDLTIDGQIVGTIRYMSPEQALGQRELLGEHTDIYSLGATLYELLTFHPPFPEEDRATLLRILAEKDPVAPRKTDPAIPRDLETIVLKCMAKEPTARYASAQAVADDLQRYLRDEPIQAKRPSLVAKAAKFARRHRSLVAMFVAMLVVAVAVLAVSVFLVARQHAEMVRQRDEARQQRILVLQQEAGLRGVTYAAQVHRAWFAWQSGYPQQARQFLLAWLPDAGREDLRSFAWYYLWASCQTPSRILRGHAAPVYCVAYSPDGKILASGSQDQTVVFWDPAKNKKLATLRGHTDDVNHIAFSPDGKLLATAGEERVVRLWDTASRAPVKVLTGFQLPVNSALFTPDGKTLVVTEVDWNEYRGQTTFWDPSTGERQGVMEGQRTLALSGDGQVLAANGPDGAVRLFQTATRQAEAKVWQTPSHVLGGALSADGQTLAIGLRDRFLVLTRRDPPDTLVGAWRLSRSLAFSPDGMLLASAGSENGAVFLWNVATHTLENVLTGHPSMTWDVAFSPDGKSLASGSVDHTVRLWDVERASRRVRLPRHPKCVQSVAFLKDGQTLATTCWNSSIRLWNAGTGAPEGSFELRGDDCLDMAFSPSRQVLAVGTGRRWLHQFQVKTGTGETTLSPCAESKSLEQSRRLAFSADGSLVAMDIRPDANRDDRMVVQIMDVQTQRELFQVARSVDRSVMSQFAFSPDGKSVARAEMVDGKGTVVVLDLLTHDVRFMPTDHGAWIPCLVYSPDSQSIATASHDRSIELLDAATGQVRDTLLGHHSGVTALAFSPDGRTLASGSNTGEIKLWDALSGQELMCLEGHTGQVVCTVFSPDGTRLATAGEASDGTGEVNLWHAPKDLPLPETSGDASALPPGFFGSLGQPRKCRRAMSLSQLGFR